MQVRRLLPTDDMMQAGNLVQQAYFQLDGYPRDAEYDAILGNVAARATDAEVLVAVDDDDSVVACLTFVSSVDSPDAEFDDVDAVGFRYFGVDPSAQGRGVGEAMVSWVFEEARRLGKRRVRIHTMGVMHGAQRLYQRTGFVREPSEDYAVDGIELLAFVRHL